MESLRYAKEMVKKNSLRIALGASLVANAAIGADAGLRDGEGVQDVTRTLYEVGKDFGREMISFPCDDPDYYSKHEEACNEPPDYNIQW